MTRTTLGLLAASVLLWLVSAVPIAIAAGIVCSLFGLNPDHGITVALAVWTLSAPLMFLRPVELGVAKLLFRAREPTLDERAKLDPVWERICREAQEDLGDYVLRVEDRDEVNATAGGARIVAVTTMALIAARRRARGDARARDRPPPRRAPDRVADQLVVRAALAGLRRSSSGSPRAVAFFVIFFRVLFLLPLLLARLASAVLNRSAEFAADRHAARLGYGPALIKVFERMVAEGHDEKEAEDDGPGRVWATHPPLPERIRRLRELPAAPA